MGQQTATSDLRQQIDEEVGSVGTQQLIFGFYLAMISFSALIAAGSSIGAIPTGALLPTILAVSLLVPTVVAFKMSEEATSKIKELTQQLSEAPPVNEPAETVQQSGNTEPVPADSLEKSQPTAAMGETSTQEQKPPQPPFGQKPTPNPGQAPRHLFPNDRSGSKAVQTNPVEGKPTTPEDKPTTPEDKRNIRRKS